MKTTSLREQLYMSPIIVAMIALAGLGIATLTHASDIALSLSIVDAARSAQAFLDREKLSQEYTIVSIKLARVPRLTGGALYEARLEATEKVIAGAPAEPYPSEIKYVLVTMDGDASLATRKFNRTK